MRQMINKRAGGRSARLAIRSAPLSENIRPIRPGMNGGNYKPLSQTEGLRIHHAALDALEQIGLAGAPDSGIEIMTRAGARLGDDSRLRFSRALVEDTLATAAKKITLCSLDGNNDLHLWGDRVHYGTAGAAVHLVEVESNEYREYTVQDLHDAAKIVSRLENVHFFQRPMVCRDIADGF